MRYITLIILVYNNNFLLVILVTLMYKIAGKF